MARKRLTRKKVNDPIVDTALRDIYDKIENLMPEASNKTSKRAPQIGDFQLVDNGDQTSLAQYTEEGWMVDMNSNYTTTSNSKDFRPSVGSSGKSRTPVKGEAVRYDRNKNIAITNDKQERLLLKNTGGILETKNSDDSDYSKITAKTLTISGLPSTAGEIGYDSGLFKMKDGSAVNNIMSHSSDGVVLKTRAGADIIFQADNFTIQDPTTASKMLKFNIASLSGTNTLNFPLIKVQTDNPSLSSEFDSQPFIFASGSNRLYCKIDDNTIAYEGFVRVSMIFSIDDVTFRTAASGGSEIANAILVGTATNMYLDVNYNNDDGTLDANPTIYYKKNNDSTGNGGSTDTGTGHLGTSVTSNTHTSSTPFIIDNSQAEASFRRQVTSGDYITASVASEDDSVTSTQVSEKYYFVNGNVWGSCAATTGPDQTEFLESFSGGINGTNKGYKLPTLSGGAFSNSQYHSNLGSITIAADSGSEYIYFGYPTQGGSVSTIQTPGGEDMTPDFRTVQTADRENSAGYTETYNFYVSQNTGVSSTVVVT